MKVAVCLSGEPRDFNYIWNDFREKLNLESIDFYIHTWHSDSLVSNLPLHNERGGMAYQNQLAQISSSEYVKKIDPTNFLVENFYSSHPYTRFSTYTLPSTISRMFSMFYGIQSVSNLIANNNYDYVIRSRPDIFLERKINWNHIVEKLSQDPHQILLPDLWINIGGLDKHWTEAPNYCPDFFCIYKASFNIFCTIYDDITQFCGLHTFPNLEERGNLPCIPEIFLSHYLKSKGIKISTLDFKMMLARHHRQISNGQNVF